ncbi:hypothetical protein C6568_03765 [Melaminivora suipulveris]|uniref:Uncharacterized protein n=1 Tax=Melaminivora suipulveris TaxID=2109913 RepID=A0A2R3Q9X4_9BURK|nr:hypothetical protein C6568_03765 [Melaminivora suipulveris]
MARAVPSRASIQAAVAKARAVPARAATTAPAAPPTPAVAPAPRAAARNWASKRQEERAPPAARTSIRMPATIAPAFLFAATFADLPAARRACFRRVCRPLCAPLAAAA